MIQFNGIFNSRLTVVIQFNKLFNSTDCSIQLKSNLIVCPYFSLSVTKIWNLADFRTFFGYISLFWQFFFSIFNRFYKIQFNILFICKYFDKIQFKNLFICQFSNNIQFNNLFIFKYLGEIQFKNVFKMLKLAEFNSMKYSFNKKTRVSNRANLQVQLSYLSTP